MFEVLEKQKKYVVVKMDIRTYKKFDDKKLSLQELEHEAMVSEGFKTHDALMKNLMS